MNKKVIAILAYVVAVVFLAVAIFYFVTPADKLPAFMPGHDVTMTKVHFKHGLAALLLAIAAAAFGWFQGGPQKSAQEEN